MNVGARMWNGSPWPDGDGAARIALLDGPSPDCFAAFASLAEDATTEVENALAVRLASPDWTRRRAACEALGARARAPETVEAIAARLDDSSPHVVAAACRALGRIGACEHHPRIAALLTQSNEDVRRAAIEALDTYGTAESVAVLFCVLVEDASETVRRSAAFALFRHATAATWRPLFERWRSDALARHRAWAADLAARFGDTACVPTLELLEQDADGHVRRAASLGLLRVRERPTLE